MYSTVRVLIYSTHCSGHIPVPGPTHRCTSPQFASICPHQCCPCRLHVATRPCCSQPFIASHVKKYDYSPLHSSFLLPPKHLPPLVDINAHDTQNKTENKEAEKHIENKKRRKKKKYMFVFRKNGAHTCT